MNDQHTDAEAPRRARRGASLSLVILPLLYVILIGPAAKWYYDLPSPMQDVVDVIYVPLEWLGDYSPFESVLQAYIEAWTGPRCTGCHYACVNNLRQIDSGKEQLAMADAIADGDPLPAKKVNEYIKGNTTPTCPEGGIYTYGPAGTNPICSFATNANQTYTSHVLP